MAELTTDEVAAHFSAMGDSVALLTAGKDDDETDAEWVLRKARNQEHLVLQKAQKHDDDSSWWGSESMTAIDAAIAA